MRFYILVTCFIFTLFSCNSGKENLKNLIDDRLEQSVQHYLLMGKSLEDNPTKLPRTIDPSTGKLLVCNPDGWISGFVPGTMWYLYEYGKNPAMLEYAQMYTSRLEQEQYNTRTHDLGFMLYCSYGNGYRLAQTKEYKDIMLTGAESLASRYNPVVGCIKSWESNSKWQFPVIIDNMMNLEFLFWASRASGNPKYKDISISHADKTIANHFRPDYGTYHVVSYDTISGQVEKKNTSQGFSDGSTWSRGEAWGLYGYVMTYRETKEKRYLEQARHIANFILNHPNLPEDKIPYWDFNAPDIPNTLRDASAGAVIASALIELSDYVDQSEAKNYLQIAEKQIRTLSSPEYFAGAGTNGNFILKHSVGSLPHNSEVDVPLSYADYYYVEALLRMKSRLSSKL